MTTRDGGGWWLVALVLVGTAAGCSSGACPPGTIPTRGACVERVADAGADPDPADAAPSDAAAIDAAVDVDGALTDAAGIDAGVADAGDTPVDACVPATFHEDADGDGFGAGPPITACVAPVGFVSDASDCDDTRALVHPGAADACNAVDDDCDGELDEDGAWATFYRDADGDGHGLASAPLEACSMPAGHATTSDDCDDTRASVRPGAAEACNLRDDDCDATIDEGVTTAYYVDCDGDGFAASTTDMMRGCAEPAPPAACPGGEWTTLAPTSATTRDCRAADPDAFPGQVLYAAVQVTVQPGERTDLRHDYDCDGVETRQYTAAAPSCVPSGPPPAVCTPAQGWEDGSPPACGYQETMRSCSTFCGVTTMLVRQPCR